MPSEGVERETALDRLRTEIMSGKGPDVFLITCNGGRSWKGEEAIFQIPEKAMNAGIFLPLDKYIEKAQFMEWDELTPAVMEAGCNEEGRMILPLAYTVPVTVYRKADVSHVPSKTMTWQDMLEDESLVLTAAANWLPTPEEAVRNQNECGGVYVEYALGELADYSEEELLFAEEGLFQRAKEIIDLKKRQKEKEFSEVPYHFQIGMHIGNDMNIGSGIWRYSSYKQEIESNEDITLVPIYSDDGGVTATVINYAAINSNTNARKPIFCFRCNHV